MIKSRKKLTRVVSLFLVFVLAFSMMGVTFAAVKPQAIQATVFLAEGGTVRIPAGTVNQGQGIILNITGNSGNSTLSMQPQTTNNFYVGNPLINGRLGTFVWTRFTGYGIYDIVITNSSVDTYLTYTVTIM